MKPLAQTENTDVTYTLLRSGRPVDGCSLMVCRVPLAVGDTASFTVRVSSSQAGVVAQESDPTPTYRQWPDVVPELGPIGLKVAEGMAAGQGVVSVTWPTPPNTPGFEAVPDSAQHGTETRSGLRAGRYQFSMFYELKSEGGVALLPSAQASLTQLPDLRSPTVRATAVVVTKPGQPSGCQATRSGVTEVAVSGCVANGDGGLPVLTWYYGTDSARPEQAVAFNPAEVPAPLIPVASSAAGRFYIWTKNSRDWWSQPLEVLYSPYSPSVGGGNN
jgi:hypothetical protein